MRTLRGLPRDERLTKDKEDVEGERDDLKVRIEKVENERQEAASAKDDAEKKRAGMHGVRAPKDEGLCFHFISIEVCGPKFVFFYIMYSAKKQNGRF